MLNFLMEFIIVLIIQRQLDDPTLLSLNKWHWSKSRFKLSFYSGSYHGTDRKS
jgi:hypothetical protein